MNSKDRQFFEDLGSYILLRASQKRTLAGELAANIKIDLQHFTDSGHEEWFSPASKGGKAALAQKTETPLSRKIIKT